MIIPDSFIDLYDLISLEEKGSSLFYMFSTYKA